MDNALPALTETRIRDVLIASRGDLFVASQQLGMTALKLDRAIRASEELQDVFAAIKQTKALESYSRLSQEQVEADVTARLAFYRADALDALHDLATMRHDGNAGLAQVKLLAAQRLSGPVDGLGGGGDLEQTLRHLNSEYEKTAPRIREIRQTVVTLETEPRIING